MTAAPSTGAAAEPASSSAEPGGPRRAPGLALARVHLRLGSFALARTELEILGARGALDPAGLVDLAEVRWRLGDLGDAGRASTAALEAGAQDPMALVVAAEAAAAIGRPNEARRLAGLALERIGGPVDHLFAGMPRAGVWPADADEPPPTPGTLFHHEPPPAMTLRAGETDPGVARARAPQREVEPETETATPATLGLWGDEGEATTVAAPDDLPDAAGELEAGRAALLAGDPDEGALRLALALRLAPALAPAILEATEGASTPALSVIRGDAYRQIGLESAARRAYAVAAWSGARDRRRSVPRSKRARRPGPHTDDPVGHPAPDSATGADLDGPVGHPAPDSATGADLDGPVGHPTPDA